MIHRALCALLLAMFLAPVVRGQHEAAASQPTTLPTQAKASGDSTEEVADAALQETQPPSIADAMADATTHEGLFRTYRDARAGKVFLELPGAGDAGVLAEFLYVQGLRTGLGSNPVGLDRGKLGRARLFRARRFGDRVLFEEPNLAFRALTDAAAERRAVAESFATSVHWGTSIVAESDGNIVIDMTSFIVRDAFGVSSVLRATDQGNFQLDRDRSALDVAASLSFPDNLEFEAVLTFSAQEPGRHVRSTTPTPTAVTLVQHHSFVRLPGPGYRPREDDPRAGYFAISFRDYAAPIAAQVEKRWILRHRLQRAADGSIAAPIVYYVDPGAPPPIREALLDGARWWATAFAAAGFDGGFRVDVLPPGAHPLDARYNVIQWVHRSTRGWSYGGSVVDPRTGEIVKGHVSLGSLRVRQDRLLFEGLVGAAATGSGAANDPVQLSLARIRQLSAHEVGHTLGLAHNFAASTYDGRASVMDYPAPLIRIANGDQFDFSDVYGVGVGSWDLQAIRYGYQSFAVADEKKELTAILEEGIAAKRLYLSDEDARAAGAAHPLANLWDNGADPIAELQHAMRVRRIALARFGAGAIAAGTPTSRLEEALVPVYLHHRYQVAAAAKSIGGVHYVHGVNGDGQPGPRVVSGDTQRKALAALIACLEAEELDLSDSVLQLIEPRSFPGLEGFSGKSAPAFDRLQAATVAADLVFRELAQPQRCARIYDQQLLDPTLPGLAEVFTAVRDAVVERPRDPRRRTARLLGIRVAMQRAWVDRLLALATAADARPSVRERAETELVRLQRKTGDPRIPRFLERQESTVTRPTRPETPPGSPIGLEATGCSCGAQWQRH
ncbi:MAG: zinc-dependent metalloprotease [Planctomycetota bacterium]